MGAKRFRIRSCTSLILAVIGICAGLQLSWTMASSAAGIQRTSSDRWAYELQRALAHQRMENTMYASTPSSRASGPMCPVLVNVGRSRPVAVDLRGAWSRADATDAPFSKEMGSESESDSESDSALDFFLNHISGPIIQAKCVNCHVEGGVSGHTRLILHPSSNPDHGTLNLAVFEDFLADVEDGANLILNKIQGVSHGGGIQVPAGSDDFANMESFLSLLGYGEVSGPNLTPETLFDTVTLASPGKTLRRAALIFGGIIPTREEREAIDNGTEEDLRTAIRNLMTGTGFHEFLVRASNDRLLTDRHLGFVIESSGGRFVNFSNLNWAKRMEAADKGYVNPIDYQETRWWWDRVQYGFSRAPLELIAYVVENDLPYTEILTAAYIMANPMASEAYGASIEFEDSENPLEFKPSEIVSYYRDDDSKVSEYREGIGRRVTIPGNLSTDYPHAGVLNTTVFLLRYPTTPTNRNRARSRWTYYHFLGLDIEKSAARTTDPVALADTNSPTMNNAACTVCHRVMDPVAGTFQNYGEEGEYRDEWGGRDSLDRFYKDPPDGRYTPYQEGDSWYRDMRNPGFNGQEAPDPETSVQWLANQIVSDDRFAEAAVKFWWPSIVGVEVVSPPEDENDADFEAMLLASSSQTAEVKRLAEAFRSGISGRDPHNLKDLLMEIVLSPWFRAESISDDDPVRTAALRVAGVERLLTPEELAWKTHTITGHVWGREIIPHLGSNADNLTDAGRYRLFYGGIDSGGITERADDMTALMTAVAQSHAVESSCPIVQREFLIYTDEKRRLFAGIDKHVSPVWEFSGTAMIEAESWDDRESNSWDVSLEAGSKTVRMEFLNDFVDPETEADRNLILDEIIIRDDTGTIIEHVELETLEPQECQNRYWNESQRRFNGYILYCSGRHGWLELPVTIPEDGSYQVTVVGFQNAAGDSPAMLELTIQSDIETSQGAAQIRRKLVELHEMLLGVTVSQDSPDVDAAFDLFVEVWNRQSGADDPLEVDIACDIGDILIFEGVADETTETRANDDGYTYTDFNWDRIDPILRDVGWWSQQGLYHPVIRAWTAVLAYLMMDYRYLFL